MAFSVRSVSVEHLAVNSSTTATHVWMVGGPETELGFTVHYWNNTTSKWDVDTTANTPKGIRIAVDSTGKVYIVDRAGKLFQRAGTPIAWTEVSIQGASHLGDVAVQDNGTDLYTISVDAEAGAPGNKVYKRVDTAWKEIDKLHAVGIAIDSGSSNNVWFVNLHREVYRGTVSGSTTLTWTGARERDAAGLDIAVGLSPWVIGASPSAPDGEMVYKKSSGSWSTQGAFAKVIAATKTGDTSESVWIVDAQGTVQAGP